MITKPLVLNEDFNKFRNQMEGIADDIHTIALKASPDFPLDTWAEFRTAIQHGYGERLYPVGTDIKIGTDPTFTVVGHNINKNPNDEEAFTVTLLAKDRLLELQFDSPEAMMYCEDGLAAGTYWFEATTYGGWAAGNYQFTLANAVPAGGQIGINGNQSTAITSLSVQTFASQMSTAVIETAAISSGNSGTYIGKWETELNHPQRISYGSNNYGESAMRQFLNTAALKGTYWTPQTKFDRPPSWMNNQDGFLKNMSEDFINAVGAVDVACRNCETYEAPDTLYGGKNTRYTLRDKIWLPSMAEINFANESIGEATSCFPFYIGCEDADRIKRTGASAGDWWLRSPDPWYASRVRPVGPAGALGTSSATSAPGVVPACTIY